MPIPRTERGNFSPLDRIAFIISASPGAEAAACLTIPPRLSLFEPESPGASVVLARKDHDRMREQFREHDILTYNMRDIIGQELALKRAKTRSSTDFHTQHSFLQELRRRTMLLHMQYRIAPDIEALFEEMEQLFNQDVISMGCDAAIALNAVLTNITDIQGVTKPFNPSVPPAGNFIFFRDTAHITGDKMGLHQMFYPIRDQEVALARIGYDALGMQYETISGEPGTLSIEGGDILPMELDGNLFAAIGTAERTNYAAVERWFEMHEELFSASGEGIIPLMVQGPAENTQDQMHLDTFMQQVAQGAIIHCGEITRRRNVSVLMRKGGQIVQVRPEKAPSGIFSEWIENTATHIHDMSRADQLKYAPNVLVHGSAEKETTVFVTRSDTPEVTNFIRQHAAKVVLLNIANLTKLYGGAHCATQEGREHGTSSVLNQRGNHG